MHSNVLRQMSFLLKRLWAISRRAFIRLFTGMDSKVQFQQMLSPKSKRTVRVWALKGLHPIMVQMFMASNRWAGYLEQIIEWCNALALPSRVFHRICRWRHIGIHTDAQISCCKCFHHDLWSNTGRSHPVTSWIQTSITAMVLVQSQAACNILVITYEMNI